jgi:hypothetical protein
LLLFINQSYIFRIIANKPKSDLRVKLIWLVLIWFSWKLNNLQFKPIQLLCNCNSNRRDLFDYDFFNIYLTLIKSYLNCKLIKIMLRKICSIKHNYFIHINSNQWNFDSDSNVMGQKIITTRPLTPLWTEFRCLLI